MKSRNQESFAEFMTPALEAYDNAASASNSAYEKLENCRPQKLVNDACKNEAEIINRIAASRNLDEMIALELRLQRNDLEEYAHSPKDRKNVEQGLADLECGMHAYDTLKTNPGQYRESAKSYTDSNRDKRLDVPKDGMRYAMGSQTTRLQNRQSLQLSEEEKEILAARRALVASIIEEYSLLQKAAMRDDGERALTPSVR